MGLTKAIGAFIRKKLGITEARVELQERVRFLSAYANAMLPEQIHFSPEVLRYSRSEIEERYGIREFNPGVHKNDLMFQHHLRKMPHKAPEALFHYFNVGLDALSKIKKLHTAEVKSMLDFGAGYGRGSRFLPSFFPEAQISVSEVKNQALRFQSEAFGYKPIEHDEGPDSFSAYSFDLIVAISVFSHLPKDLAAAWLRKLYACLNEEGSLVFTFNGVRYAPVSGEEYQFISQSEDEGMSWVSDRLKNSANYGSAFYSENEMRKMLQSSLDAQIEIIPDFSGQQDAVVIRK